MVSGLVAGQTYQFRLTALDGVPNESAGVTTSVSPTGAATEYATLSGTLAADTVLKAGVYVIPNSATR